MYLLAELVIEFESWVDTISFPYNPLVGLTLIVKFPLSLALVDVACSISPICLCCDSWMMLQTNVTRTAQNSTPEKRIEHPADVHNKSPIIQPVL